MSSKVPKKNSAAVALGRKGGKKGGPARAAKLTAEERSNIARKAVRARWDKADAERERLTRKTKTPKESRVINAVNGGSKGDTSDAALLVLLNRIKATEDPAEIRKLSNELERVIFRKQYRTA